MPLRLSQRWFKPAVADDREQAHLYFLGGVVFLNCPNDTITRFLNGIHDHVEEVKKEQPAFQEAYCLEIDPNRVTAITNDYAVLPHRNQVFLDIICFVIAKSVALECIEARVDIVFDEVEVLIANLATGNLGVSDRAMATLVSSILSLKFTSIAHIMVLDKPEITWDNSDADHLYLSLS